MIQIQRLLRPNGLSNTAEPLVESRYGKKTDSWHYHS